jgi:spore maturation protein CgeB
MLERNLHWGRTVKIVIFGLSVSSSWGNGHATVWRGLIDSLSEWGHVVIFFERDVPYYAAHRDRVQLEQGEVIVYSTWEEARPIAEHHLIDADAAVVTSLCPDAAQASEVVLASSIALKAFYDLETPVTLERAKSGAPLPYIPIGGLRDFDLVLSMTGGTALDDLKTTLGAKRTAALYPSVDPRVHVPTAPSDEFKADMSFLGAYTPDRQRALEDLFIQPARFARTKRFVIAGSQYPAEISWPENIKRVMHVFPDQQAAFYCSSQLTLSIARKPMSAMGHCPSGQLFEAAACGVPIISDDWRGVTEFFEPGREILIVHTPQDALVALSLSPSTLEKMGQAAKERALAEHTAKHRAHQLLEILSSSAETVVVPETVPAMAGRGLGTSAVPVNLGVPARVPDPLPSERASMKGA